MQNRSKSTKTAHRQARKNTPSTATQPRLNYASRLFLAAWCSAFPIAGAVAQQSLVCTGYNPMSCNNDSGTLTAPVTLTDSDQNFNVTNNATLVLSDGANPVGVEIFSQGIQGTQGSQTDRNGGQGYDLTLTNNGSVSMNINGIATEMAIGVRGSSRGGLGLPQKPSSDNEGGNGGAGGTVTLTNNNAVTLGSGTNASYSSGAMGVYAESAGGNGGPPESHAIDHYGGNGGNAGTVTLTNNASVSLGTAGTPLLGSVRAWAVAAESFGGSTGNYAKGQITDGSPAGQAGSAGDVTLTNLGNVSVYWTTIPGTTTSDGVVGIMARSFGGTGGFSDYSDDSGGNGGNTGQVKVNVGSAAGGAKTLVVASGGPGLSGNSAGVLGLSRGGVGGNQESHGASGGAGGNAGGVTIQLNNTQVSTAGDGVAGVVGFSRGGNGGQGNATDHSTDGGNGGNAGNVSVSLDYSGSTPAQASSVSTNGLAAYGLLAQSVGGFGGTGTSQGGIGQNAGTAFATTLNYSSVTTIGDFAAGIVTQSIGGGGGTGTDFTDGLAGAGGNGGNGGSGTDSTISTSGAISTTGQHAYGLLAQSIGGSGGTGGVGAGLLLALGGDGGAGGGGGTVSVTNAGSVRTNGYGSTGMTGQSIGGGGGAAGAAGGLIAIGGSVSASQNNSGGGVTVTNTGLVSTQGDAAIGLLGQSIGGGGGSAATTAGLLSIGGTGGSGGNGDSVTVHADGTQQTSGRYAYGAVAQSIGGGGGNGGDAFGVTTAAPIPTLGGSAGAGGSGGVVFMTVNNNGVLGTVGDGSTGLLAQSIGGGGGSGGSASQLGVLDTVSLAIGGAGGSGGWANTVTVQTSGATLTTNGASAAGIVAQSIGGGGGSGGTAQSLDVNLGFSLGVTVGGSAGLGGSANKVSVTLDNTSVSTAGLTHGRPPAAPGSKAVDQTDSYGILAQSIGGGGGNGGSVASQSIALEAPIPDGTSFAIGTAVAVGASGGSGGDGSEVDVTLSGTSAVQTDGQGSHGVMAQSIGGGGGNGGDSKAMSRTVTIEDTAVAVNVDTAVGGQGGVTGDAALVNLQLHDTARITTYGDYSNALMGQSIGGGGGNAGIGSSGSGGIASGKSYTVNVGVGGKGGAGGEGGPLQATLDPGARIATFGSGSRGVLLQSIGGGGGASQGATVDLGLPFSSGGGDTAASATTSFSASVNVSVGEKGAGGGSGDTITLTDNGTIITWGNDADGLLLQSIGGSGGLGGSAGSDASAGPSSYPSGGNNPDAPPPPPSNDTNLGSYSLSVAVGGKGGGGGNGGAVTVNYAGLTATQGELADAMVVQSIGGGGGVGGSATAKGAKGDAAVQIAVGGTGGAAGDGGLITLNMQGKANGKYSVLDAGQFATLGNVAYGLLAQSIGGGGGQGADGSSDVTYKTATTPSLLLGVNGTGGNGGRGGAINMNAPGSLVGALTHGTGSHAVVLQSIGGGGGTASMGSSVSVKGSSLILQFGGGGTGSASGGGDVTVNSSLLSATTGHGAYGFVGQSIGGGGGIAYAGQAANISSATIDNTGQSNANDASGGAVNVTLNAVSGTSQMDDYLDMRTLGSAAHGIVLQSIGGGGGIAGDPAASSLQMGWQGGGQARSGATSANGGDITLNLNSMRIKATGDNSYGIIMQSIADGGGLGGTTQGSFAGSVYNHANGGGSKAGSITFTQTGGQLLVYGSNPVGVFAQSDGNISQASPISLTINGTLQTMTGDPNGVGVWLDGGSVGNTVTVGGWIDSTVAVQQTRNGVTTVTNTGTISGSQILTADNSDAVGVVNNTGTLLNAAIIKGTVFNDGAVLIGSRSQLGQMRVTNDFNQGAAGALHVNTDFSNMQVDTISVDGAARLGGRVQIDALTLMPNRELTFMQAGTLTPNAAVGGASDLFDFNARYTPRTASVSVGNANFNALSSKYGVGSNLREMGSHLQNIWDRGSNEELGALYAQLDYAAAGGASGYSSALSDLSPGASAAPAALATGAMKGFGDSLFSCPWFSGKDAQTSEGDCTWGRITDKTTRLDAGRGTSSTRSESMSYQLGAQKRIAPSWILGFSGAYENSTIRTDDSRIRSKGDTGYLGAVLKYETGPWTFSGATYGSYGAYDNQRTVGLTSAQAKSDSKVWSIGQQLRASYTYATDKAYIKPYANLDLIYTSMPGYSERGAGTSNLNIKSADNLTALLSPGIEVGGRIDFKNGYTARPFVNVGVSLASTDKWDSRAQLAAAPAGSPDFKTTLDTGRVFGQASVGVQLSSRGGFDVRLQYDAVASDRVRSSGGSVKATWRY